jgi:hypothetical protein
LGNAVGCAIRSTYAFEVNARNAILYLGPVVTGETVIDRGETLELFTRARPGKIEVEQRGQRIDVGTHIARHRHLGENRAVTFAFAGGEEDRELGVKGRPAGLRGVARRGGLRGHARERARRG